ncbi:MAG: DNA-binding protein YbiB [Pseudomonadota bacterium]|nr:DNA-binding protein YbiB [Pseudomonadota bacterium]
MNYAPYFKLLATTLDPSQGLDEETSHLLYSALFDAGLPELEAGAFIAYSHARSASLQEILGLQRALAARVTQLRPPQRDVSPVLIPTYCGTVNYPNLTALLALLLQRYEIPVLLHGTLEGHGGVATAYVLREFNILPSGSAQHAQTCLDQDLLAFVPTAVLSPGLAQLISLRSRVGLSNQYFFPAALLDPFAGQGLHLSNVANFTQAESLREVYRSTGHRALLFRGTEGEPFANPTRRPALEFVSNGEHVMLFDDESGRAHSALRLPRNINLSSTTAWIKQALAGVVAIPHPLLNQLACCLFASGYTKDIHQAKAIAAMSATGLVSP